MPLLRSLDYLSSTIERYPTSRRIGRVQAIDSHSVSVSGLSDVAQIGDSVTFGETNMPEGEIVSVSSHAVSILIDHTETGLKIGQAVRHLGAFRLYPDDTWLGRVIDGNAMPLDAKPMLAGTLGVRPLAQPPKATERRSLGARIATGYAVFDSLLPIVRGQRLGLFSGSGVGKSTLMAALAQEMEADVIVIALVGERGREVNHFVKKVLGPKGLSRSVVVAATSDRSPLARRRAAFSAMAIAEHFRDQGRHVLLMVDSVTRLAEAHREVSLASGESGSMRGFPPSLTNLLAGFAERAGPGCDGQGDITAIFTVLVAASDMDEPVADTLRGLLDGHIVLARNIAERGRFPAVDVLQSVSRSLPEAASAAENDLIQKTRQRLGLYEDSEIMIRSGLYQSGSNPDLDLAIRLQPELDLFLSKRSVSIETSFAMLAAIDQIPNNPTD